ncbi:hypothetical protein LJC42_02305 [Eubacteriales bacterium OttesenSCG-928-K08]|nr:hypothetical protein [Eubacteriales bacterium OttesenSCG-928-K08]
MSITGRYKIQAKTPIGPQTGVLSYIAEGNSLKGSATIMGNTVPITTGTVSGNSFSHGITLKTFLGKFNTIVTGKVDGNAISGHFNWGNQVVSFNGQRI